MTTSAPAHDHDAPAPAPAPAPAHDRATPGPPGPAVLVLGGGTRLPEALRRHGWYVVYGGAPEEFTPAHHRACDEAWLHPDAEPGAWVRRAVAVHHLVPFERVVTVRERYLTTAARIADTLGLGGNPLDTVLLLKDKSLMRAAFDPLTDESAVRARIMDTPHDVDAFVAWAGLPVVLKPRDGSGSEGIAIVRDAPDIAAARARVEERPSTLLAEEFLDGPEFSVETFSGHGQHRVLAVTEKFTGDNAVEIGHVVPARVTAPDRAALEAAACRFLDAIGLTEGPGHTEIILTPRGPRVVESHNRPGGDGIVDLVRHVTGLDIRDLLAAQAAGVPAPEPDPEPAGAAATWFLTAAPGVATEVSGWDTAAAAPGVVSVAPATSPGDTVRELRGSGDRCGSVTAVAATPDEALARARGALAHITLHTDAVPGAPTSPKRAGR
ncbi:ATP-grasp domain-containing protein [Streptomyces sp. NPDC048416]|uniref:ATP-grasp domain-containing protein n=1 Tax=Streptomyces sp. NPDC048416 TaxID=3365546 RepID=UPI0037128690